MKSCNQSGFTLIEILVAMTIFAMAILGLTAGTVTVARTNKGSHLQASAVNLAQGKIEELRAMSAAAFAALSCPSYTTTGCWDTPTASATSFNRSWQIAANTPVTGVTQIEVKVDWIDQTSRTVKVSASVLSQ